jgi:hypothetical protein
MTIGGWIVMIVSISSVTFLFGWCVWKVCTTPGEVDRVHGFEETPPDVEDS